MDPLQRLRQEDGTYRDPGPEEALAILSEMKKVKAEKQRLEAEEKQRRADVLDNMSQEEKVRNLRAVIEAHVAKHMTKDGRMEYADQESDYSDNDKDDSDEDDNAAQ
jgi:hypothetical protein